MAEINPTLAMGVQSAQPAQTPVANPLEFMGGLLQLQRGATALQSEQGALAARQRAGQIMSSAPDLQSGLNALQRDPSVAGFAPEIINQNLAAETAAKTLDARTRAGAILAQAPSLEAGINAMQQDPSIGGFAPDVLSNLAGVNASLVSAAGARQTQAESGMGTLLKTLSAGINDPSMVKPAAYAALKTMSPDAQKANMDSYTQIVHSLTDNLPSDPEQARQVYQRRLAGLSMSAGLSGEQIRGMTGTVAPSISIQPMGPGGAPIAVQTGGAVTGPSNAQIVGAPQQAAPASPTGDLTAPTVAPSGPLVGQSAQEQAANVSKGQAAGELSREMAAASDIALPLKKIDMMTNALSQFQSGGMAGTRTEIGTAMQGLKNIGLPIDQDTIDKVANGSLTYSQLFESEVKPFLVKQLTDAAAGQGRVTKTEVDSFITSMDSTKDPATVMKLLNQAKYSLQIQYDKSQKYLDYKQMLKAKDPSVAGLDENDFPEWYIHHFSPASLPAETGGGMSLAPTPQSSALGASPEPSAKRPDISTFYSK